MLLSKANLEVVKVASRDPFDRGLNGVRLERDGSTVAGNGSMLLAVGPADSKKVHFPESAADQISPGEDGLLVPVEAVENAVRHLPKDKRPSLQHLALSRVKDPSRVGFTTLNPKGDPTTSTCLPKSESFPDWKDTLRRVRGDGTGHRVCISRSNFIRLLKALDDACPESKGADPVFLEISPQSNGLLVRGVNRITGQHVVGAATAYRLPEDQWLRRDAWERKVFNTPMKRRKRRKK